LPVAADTSAPSRKLSPELYRNPLPGASPGGMPRIRSSTPPATRFAIDRLYLLTSESGSS